MIRIIEIRGIDSDDRSRIGLIRESYWISRIIHGSIYKIVGIAKLLNVEDGIVDSVIVTTKISG
ncbi:hypothetical protein QA634_14890 [Methylobacterium sp. CB376]|uniref:hypothetical protein n=1 Tax=unclassified Methylobacterium TaxID=2615210 RepID=UPI0012378829|nr:MULTISPECIES: hypothetical protein [Methylobacterium]WFT83032.1 hypothetical protein QA634_14890 [Methylobacterium nodulans]